MKVLVDARLIDKSGIGRYIRDLVVAFLKASPESTCTLMGNLEEINHFRSENSDVSERIKGLSYKPDIYSFKEQIIGTIVFWKLAKKNDIVHFPHFNVPWIVPANSIVTVHDLILFERTRMSGIFVRLKQYFARIVLQHALTARSVITDSDIILRQLVSMYPNITSKIRVVYPSIGQRFHKSPPIDIEKLKAKYDIDQYILYVGNRKPHKNLSVLIEAFKIVKNIFPDLQLVVVGKKFEKDPVYIEEQLGLPGLKVLENVDDFELPLFYGAARAVVMPSLYEGFGYPPLEALACGTPVIVSDIGIFRETLNTEGVVYFDPQSKISLVVEIERVLKNPSVLNPDFPSRNYSQEALGHYISDVYKQVCYE